MTTELTELQVTAKDWNVKNRPTWCPGCGDFGVLSATKKGLVGQQINPENTVIVSGIGCSSNFPHFLNGYGLHTLHGRAVPVAEGVKLANPDLEVVVTGGDGDGLAIGIGGFLHAARRNLDMTYIIMDNQVYGLTVNQASPTSHLERITRSTPYGNIEHPFNPVALAITAGATFVARTFSKDGEQFERIVAEAIKHKGFAFIDALSPCVTFNRVNTVDYFKDRVYDLNEKGHDTSDFQTAYLKSLEWSDEGIPTGIFFQKEMPAYSELDATISKFGSPVARGAVRLTSEMINNITKDFM
ncbi:MAG: 2-oxoacid:ferredoxin oxidoreductase subunit beta [Candidatus Kariarchaeaceae archaeon]|jgi:2-oxoglutarate ferredoxin oxidoreductase subunit beta